MKIRMMTNNTPNGLYIRKKLGLLDLKNNYVIRWGNFQGNTQKGLVLNSSQAIKNSLDKEMLILILRKNHVNCPKRLKPGKKSEFPIMGRSYEHHQGRDIKIIESLEEYRKSDCDYFVEYIKIIEEYRLHVMDNEVFYIEEKYKASDAALEDLTIRTEAFGWRFKQVTLFTKPKVVKNIIINLAQKAIYSLGLDFGVVTVGKDINGRYLVLDVDATCDNLCEESRLAYVKAFTKILLKYDSEVYRKEEVTLGADPEFILKDKDSEELIYASDFFKSDSHCGLDARSIESGKEYFPLVEVRPNYSINPLKVLGEIKRLLQQAENVVHYKNIGLYAGSMPLDNYWAGGHIHFGIKVNFKLLRALDNYLALPLMMIENPSSSRKRKYKYGDLGDYREKSYGGFEYRTLSSWLVSPEIALGVLCLAKVIAFEYLELKEEFLCNYSDIRAYYSINKDYFKDNVIKIINKLSNTCTYKIFKNEIDPLFNKIKKSEEWEETKDMKETWKLSSSTEVYEQTKRCFIPKAKREELGIDLGESISIIIGRSKYQLKVYPKDDFSLDKKGFISFSKDISYEIGEKELSLWREDGDLKGGPVLGIFSYKSDHELGPFGFQSTLFKRLIKFARDKGMIAYVFTIWDTDWKNKRINGYTYDFTNDEWEKRYYPLPDVIYDRGDIVDESYYGQRATDFKAYIQKYAIKFINSLEFINLINDKWATYSLLNSYEETAEYQVKTKEYYSQENLIDFLNRYNHIYLKLKNGSRSKGIFSIQKLDTGQVEINFRDQLSNNKSMKTDKTELVETLKEYGFSSEDYIMQKAIPLAKYSGRSFEIRVVMQKNSDGIWLRACMIARCASRGDKFLNARSEIDLKAVTVLDNCFNEKAEEILERLREAAWKVVECLDRTELQMGEVAIDFGIDENGNVFIIELNSKPDNLLATIGAYRMRNLYMYRILEYAKHLIQIH